MRVLLGIAGGVMAYCAVVLSHVAAASVLAGDGFVWLALANEPLVVAHVAIMPVLFAVAYRSIRHAGGLGRRGWPAVLGVGASCFAALSAWPLLVGWLYEYYGLA